MPKALVVPLEEQSAPTSREDDSAASSSSVPQLCQAGTANSRAILTAVHPAASQEFCETGASHVVKS